MRPRYSFVVFILFWLIIVCACQTIHDFNRCLRRKPSTYKSYHSDEMCFYPGLQIIDSNFYQVLDSVIQFYFALERPCPLDEKYAHLLHFGIIIDFDSSSQKTSYRFSISHERGFYFAIPEFPEWQKDRKRKLHYGVFYYRRILFAVRNNQTNYHPPFELTGYEIPVIECKYGSFCSSFLGYVNHYDGNYTFELRSPKDIRFSHWSMFETR